MASSLIEAHVLAGERLDGEDTIARPLANGNMVTTRFWARAKTHTALPEAETAPKLSWAFVASGQIIKCKVEGWEPLTHPPFQASIDVAARCRNLKLPEIANQQFSPHSR